MKKIIILIVCIGMFCMPFNAFAVAEDFTKEEAEALLIEGYQRWTLIQEGRTPGDGKYLKEDDIKVDYDLQKRTKFNTKGDGSAYKNPSIPEELDYVPVTDERFNTIKKCYDYVEQVFTDDMAKRIIEINAYINEDDVESIRLSNGGKLLTSSNTYEDWEDGQVMILYAHRPAEPLRILDSIGEFTVSRDTAKLTVRVLLLELHTYDNVPEGAIDIFPGGEEYFDDSLFRVPYEMEVTFVKTSDGWRISGGSFFETIMWKQVNPSTGDSTPIIIALLTLSGIVLACVPVVKRRRR